MTEAPPFLTFEQVLAFHQVQLELYGGQTGLRNEGLLYSALAQPEAGLGDNYYHSFPYEMAAAYAFHIAENQPFIDGNKRVALACCLTFLDLCSITIDDPKEELYDAMIAIGTRQLSKEGFADLLERLAGESDPDGPEGFRTLPAKRF